MSDVTPAANATRPATDERRSTVGGLLVMLAGILYGTTIVLGKWVVSAGIPAQSALAIRFAMAALILAGALAIRRRPLRSAPGEGGWLLLLGGVGYAIEASFFFGALAHGTAAAVALLFFSYPVFVAIGHIALGKGRPSRRLAQALGLSVAGAAVIIVSSGGVTIDAIGVALVLAASLSYSLFMLGSEQFLRRTGPMTSALWLCASASAGLVVLAVPLGTLQLPRSASGVLAITAMGVATTGAFTCFLAGIRRIGAVRTGIISTFEPLSAAVFAAMFLGEPLGLGILIGGALILMGAMLAIRSGPREEIVEPVP
jgi:drug/metabolite transporter (DMT)-like permease